MDTAPISRGSVLGLVLLSEAVLAVLALCIGWVLAEPPLARISWTAAAAWQGALAAVPMVVLLLLMHRWPVGPLRSLMELVERQLVPHLRACTLADIALISLVAGLGEELLFRGVLQTAMTRLTGSTWLAIAITAVAFGAVHAVSVTYFLLAGIIGAYLGWLFVFSGNLLPPILTHAIYDFAALVYLLRIETRPIRDDLSAESP
ncbi:MAG: CPBP family intramembrane glutamic endopeptidase [Pirellulales bacterium]